MELRKSYFADERNDDLGDVGVPRARSGALAHVTGKTGFYADSNFPDMLHLKMVRSPQHHARIRSIDTSEAEKHAGTAGAIPSGGNRQGAGSLRIQPAIVRPSYFCGRTIDRALPAEWKQHYCRSAA